MRVIGQAEEQSPEGKHRQGTMSEKGEIEGKAVKKKEERA